MSNHEGGDKIPGRRRQKGRVNGHGGFDENQNNISGPKRDKPDVDEEERVHKKPRIAHEEDQKSSSSDATGYGTPGRRDRAPPLLRSSSSIRSNVSDGTPPFSGVSELGGRNLMDDFDVEGGPYVMRPEVSITLKRLQEMSRENPELEAGLEIFRSAFKFLKNILLVKQATNEDKPSLSC